MTKEDKHFSEHDRIFYSQGYKLAQSAIEKGFTTQTLFEAVSSMYETIDQLNDSILDLAKKHQNDIACTKGCQWCCHQAVYANSYEIHFLSEKIKSSFPENDLKEITLKAENKSALTSKLSESNRLKYKSPCPLLKNGACSAYSYRPMACRIYLSTQLASCIEFYENPESEENYPALLDFPLRAGRMMNEGFASALKEIGIETAEFSFEDGLKIALSQAHLSFGNSSENPAI